LTAGLLLAAGQIAGAGGARAQIGTPSDPGGYSRPGTGNILTDHLAGLPTNFPGDRLAWSDAPDPLRRAYEDYSRGLFASAASRLQGFVFRSPDSVTGHRLLADVYVRQNALKDAAAEMEQVLRLDPEDAATRDNLGLAYLQTAQYDKASRLYGDALARAPKNGALAFQLALALAKGGKHAGAAAAFERAAALTPKDPRAPLYAGLLYHETAQDAKAAPLLQQALALGTKQPFQAHTALAEADASAGRTEDALRHFTLAAQADPRNALTHYNLGALHERQGRADRAAADYRQALALDPALRDAKDALARLDKPAR
jgi:tetratricopeptide (TPR) repeat protein